MKYFSLAVVLFALGCSSTPDDPATSALEQSSDVLNTCDTHTLPATQISLPADDAPINPNAMNEWFWFGQVNTRFTYHVFMFQFVVPNFICPGLCTDPSGFTTLLWGSVGVTDKVAGTFHQSGYLLPGTFQPSTNSFNLAIPNGPSATGGGGAVDHVTAATTDGYKLDLFSTSVKNPLIEFNGGFQEFVTPSGQFAGDNWYYSRPRLLTAGTLTLPDNTKVPLVGQSWFDREWDPCCFAGVAVQWDWLGLQLSDGSELMVYDIFVAGHRDQIMSRTVNFLDAPPSCAQGVLTASQFSLTHADPWTSPHSGNTYPTTFTLDVPSRQLHVTVRPTVVDQELTQIPGFFAPWYEGSITVTGTRAGHPIVGTGQAELFGYAPGAPL
jgi:predicted secreted hydrolase